MNISFLTSNTAMMFIDSLKMNSYYDLVGVAMKNTPA